jgi:hypothetical protein
MSHWALCGHAAVQRETQFQGRLNVGFQCRGMFGSRTQRMTGIRPYRQNVHGAALVSEGSDVPFVADRLSSISTEIANFTPLNCESLINFEGKPI